ncbi:Kae1-associated kinase Bud32 [Candidatus Micrarchaeota archaeon CG1_02_55_22]|nr:MAG: Kae1-associated kinase Bud32 [Candidatus Micrarchaeota archaeon CG1_02_55_22]
MKKFDGGAEATLYETTFEGKPALAKKRAPKNYRHPQLDERLRSRRTRQEAKILRAAKPEANVPELYGETKYELIESRVDGVLLRKRLEKKGGATECCEAGRQLGLLHGAGIVHGDYSTSNVLVGRKVTVIDFGLGSFSNELEKRAEDILLFKKSLQAREDELFPSFAEGYATAMDKKEAQGVLERANVIISRARYAQR